MIDVASPEEALEAIDAAVARGEFSFLIDFTVEVRASWPDHDDAALAAEVETMASALRELDMAEWVHFAALAALFRQGKARALSQP